MLQCKVAGKLLPLSLLNDCSLHLVLKKIKKKNETWQKGGIEKTLPLWLGRWQRAGEAWWLPVLGRGTVSSKNYGCSIRFWFVVGGQLSADAAVDRLPAQAANSGRGW